MDSGSFRFERFHLDPRDRQLRRDGAPVDLNSRYLDALALLVSEQGRLVSKDRFLDEVWRGVPVTDEALTQCIKTLRNRLGDDAARPRFIETVPKHGYRFVAPVEPIGADDASMPAAAPVMADPVAGRWRRFFLLGGAAMLGGAGGGLVGGLFYGFVGAASLAQAGAISVVLVLACLTMAVGILGGAGVGFGIAAAGFTSGRWSVWSVAGGAAGGMVMGALVKLVGLDAFNLLFGQAPSDMTGALEGAVLGAAVGLGVWLSGLSEHRLRLRRSVVAAGLAGGVAGVLIALVGGRLMAGSLDLLARQFPTSRLRLDPIGAAFSESGFGPISQAAMAGLEGALFAACVAGAMVIARRRLTPI